MKKSQLGLFLFLIFYSFSLSAQQTLGDRSQQTMSRIEEIDGHLTAAQRLGGLFAAYGFIVQPPGGTEAEDVADGIQTIRETAGQDVDDYTTIANYVHSIDAIKRELIQREIAELISDDESSGLTLLSDDERNFWNDFLNSLDQTDSAQGQTNGEPHLKTFDGYNYDLQAVGEYVLCRSSKQFEIQVRQKAMDASVAVNTAVAMNVHGQKISFYAADFPDKDYSTPLRINGVPGKFKLKFIKLKKGGAIQKIADGEYIVFWETGEKATVKIYSFASVMIDVIVTVPHRKKTNLQGLLGNNNKFIEDDLRSSTGVPLQVQSWKNDVQQYVSLGKLNNQFSNAEKEYNKQLQKKFADTWRVTDQSSLFQYEREKTTKNFVDKKFPLSYHSIADLSPDQLQKAKKTCKDGGVSEENMNGCIYDVAFTGENFFAKTNAYLTKSNELLNIVGVKIPPENVPGTNQAKEKLKKKVKKLILHF